MQNIDNRLPVLGVAGFGTDSAGCFVSTAGVGKDVFSDFLVSEAGFRKMAFAEPMKYGMQHLFGLSEAETWGRDGKESPMPDWGFSPRQLARTFGTEFGREMIHKDLWLEVMRRRLDNPHGHIEFGGLVDIRKQGVVVRTSVAAEEKTVLFSRVLTETAQIILGVSEETLRHCLDYGNPVFHASDGRPIFASDVLDGLQVFAAQMVCDPYFERQVGADDFLEMLDKFADLRSKRQLLTVLPPEPSNVAMPATVRGVVVTDVRFGNEMAFVKSLGGRMVVIERDLESAGMAIPPSPHPSEVSMLPFLNEPDNLRVNNNGSLEDLAAAAKNAAEWTASVPEPEGDSPGVG